MGDLLELKGRYPGPGKLALAALAIGVFGFGVAPRLDRVAGAVAYVVGAGSDVRPGVILDRHVGGGAAISWAKISKASSNATDLGSGAATNGQVPPAYGAGAITWATVAGGGGPALPVAVSNGGTHLATLTANGLLIGNGAGDPTFATGAAGTVLAGGMPPAFTAAPTFTDLTLTGRPANSFLYANGAKAVSGLTGADETVMKFFGGAPTAGAVNLASVNAVSGVLPIANGGTGRGSFPNSNLVGVNGSGALIAVAPGSGLSYNSGAGTIAATDDLDAVVARGATTTRSVNVGPLTVARGGAGTTSIDDGGQVVLQGVPAPRFVLEPRYNDGSTPGQIAITVGKGVPASVLPNGNIYLRTDGGAGTTLYVKEAGGWVAK